MDITTSNMNYLIHDTGKAYDIEYFTVNLTLKSEYRKGADMMTWMIDTFGPSPGIKEANARWYVTNEMFWFREAKDRDWFILRWS